MYFNTSISAAFEAEKNRRAFIYTLIVCIALILLAIFIRWRLLKPPVPIPLDLIEINLGNNAEGYGEVQPLIKGSMSPNVEQAEAQQARSFSKSEPSKNIEADENEDEEAAPVTRTEKSKGLVNIPSNSKRNKSTEANPAVTQTNKVQKPKFTYNGPGNQNGNNANEDNGYRYQGDKPGGKGDAGDPSGKPDSYGNNPGGKVGNGPRVMSGDRKIVRYYSFTGELDKATIYAILKVSPEGRGSFVTFAKNSTSRSQAYADAIARYLQNMQFDKADHESTITVQFNFSVK